MRPGNRRTQEDHSIVLRSATSWKKVERSGFVMGIREMGDAVTGCLLEALFAEREITWDGCVALMKAGADFKALSIAILAPSGTSICRVVLWGFCSSQHCFPNSVEG